MRSILSTYFISLGLSEHEATSMFLFTSALAYFTPVFGGLLSDALLGKYATIVAFAIVYVLGLFLLALAAYAASSPLTYWGLLLIGVGTGGIKPCVSAFGADQLKLEAPGKEGGEPVAKRGGADEGKMRGYFSAFCELDPPDPATSPAPASSR
jgi:dipeptide/tripeptide permease